jgi:hypothetical protein
MTEEPDRLRRAREEMMDIHKEGPVLYEVVSEDGSSYEIDLGAMECTCQDYRMGDAEICKHLWKGVLIDSERDIGEFYE